MTTSKPTSKTEPPAPDGAAGDAPCQTEFVGIYLPKTWAVVERLQMVLTFSGPARVRHYGRLARPTWLPHT